MQKSSIYPLQFRTAVHTKKNAPEKQSQHTKNQKATVIRSKKAFTNIRAKIIPLQHLIEKKRLSPQQKTRALKQKKQQQNVRIIQRQSHHIKKVQFSSPKQYLKLEKAFATRFMPTEKNIASNTQFSIQNNERYPRSLSYCKKEQNSFRKTLKTVKNFFQNLIVSQNGCRCKQPCKQAEIMLQWSNKTQIQATKKVNQLKQKYRSIKLGLTDKENSETYMNILKNLNQIKKDVRRTHSYHPTFQNNHFIEMGQKMLLYYLLQDQQVGYIQGMNIVMAGLLFHIKELDQAYCVFKAVMKKLRPMYINNFKQCHQLTNRISNLIFQYLPDLNTHFEEIGFVGQVNLIVFPWLLSLMGVIVKLESFHLIVQGFMSNGWQFVEKVILSFLTYRKDELMQMEDCGDILAFLSSNNLDTYDVNWKDIIQFSTTI